MRRSTTAHTIAALALTWGTLSTRMPAQVTLRTDNPQTMEVDRIVHRYASAYMAHEGAIGLTLGLVSNGKTSYYYYSSPCLVHAAARRIDET